jgi:hypothetical protein
MSRTLHVILAIATTITGFAGEMATPSQVRGASTAWKACAAQPVPAAAPRRVDPTLTRLVQKRVTAWRHAHRSLYAGISATIRWGDGREIDAISGYADQRSGRAVAVSTPFELASVSKPFTAAIALLLDACGVMPISTPVRSLVSFADVSGEATIEDLLRHESGMSDWLTDKSTRMDWLIAHPNGKVGPKTAVQNLLPRGEIGTFYYSNSGMTLVTIAAERATGVPWKQLVRELLLKPLGLNETGFGPVPNAARPHAWSRGAFRPFGQSGWGPTRSVAAVLRGAGDLFSTPRDLARFGELLWGNRLLPGSQSALINGVANLTGRSWSYTIGTMMDRSWLGGLRTYGHTGGYSGVSTTLRHIPELGITIAVTANGMGLPGAYADDLAINLVDLLDVPAPLGAMAIAQAPGGGSSAAARANPEPFPLVTPDPMTTCGDGSAANGAVLGWQEIASGEAADWSGRVTALAELTDGRLVIGGVALRVAAGVLVKGLAVRDPKSGSWSAFAAPLRANGSVGTINALVVDRARQRLFAGGDFVSVTASGRRVSAKGIALLNLATGRWSSLSSGLTGSVVVRSISLDQATGHIAVGGSFGVPGKKKTTNAAVWDVDKGWGQLYSANASASMSGIVDSVAITPSGAVHVAGNLVINGRAALIARWQAPNEGWIVTATSEALGDAPRALAVEPSGTLLAGTGIGWYGTPLVREEAAGGYGWVRAGSGLSLTRRAAWVSALATTIDGRIVVGGSFNASGSDSLQNVALWDPARGELSTLGGGLPIEPDAVASSPSSVAYAAIRLRSAIPGGTGRTCITAWGTPAPEQPGAPSVSAKRTSISVTWSASTIGSAPIGWIAEASATGHTTHSCTAAAPLLHCTIGSLDPGTKYSVRLRAFSIPVGPSPRSTAVKVATKR